VKEIPIKKPATEESAYANPASRDLSPSSGPENGEHWENLGERELPSGIEADLMDLTPRQFEVKYDIRRPSQREVYVPAADVFDLPRISDARLAKLSESLKEMEDSEIEAIRKNILHPSSPDLSAVSVAEQKVLDVLVDEYKKAGDLDLTEEGASKVAVAIDAVNQLQQSDSPDT
jgi:hypothetical protein